MNAHNEQHDPASAVVKQNLTTQPAAAQEAVAEITGINGRNGVEIHWLEGPAKIGDLLYAAHVTAAPAMLNLANGVHLPLVADEAGYRIDPAYAQERTPAAPGIDLTARPMDIAPRDGTVVRLLVQFEEHLIEDTDEPAWTIGACNDDLVPDDERTGWQVAGWCWEHDHFTEGKGTPVGWLPMLDSHKGGSDPWRGLYAPERAPNRDEYGCFYHPDIPSWDDEREESIAPLLKAQGFDLQCVPGDFSDEAMEEGGERYWQEMREWNPEPEGDGWRLVAIYDTEDGPYSMFVKPLAQAGDAEVQP